MRRPRPTETRSSGSVVALGLFLALGGSGACAAPAPATRVVPLRSYVFGTLGDREVDLRDVCGGRPAHTVTVVPSAGSVALGILTLGVYTPRELHVTCGPLR